MTRFRREIGGPVIAVHPLGDASPLDVNLDLLRDRAEYGGRDQVNVLIAVVKCLRSKIDELERRRDLLHTAADIAEMTGTLRALWLVHCIDLMRTGGPVTDPVADFDSWLAAVSAATGGA